MGRHCLTLTENQLQPSFYTSLNPIQWKFLIYDFWEEDTWVEIRDFGGEDTQGEEGSVQQASCHSPQAKSKAKKEYIPVTAGGNLADCIYSSAENKKYLVT